MLTAKERRHCIYVLSSQFAAILQPVPILHAAHRHEEIRASCVPYRLENYNQRQRSILALLNLVVR